MISSQQLVLTASQAVFDKPLVTNVYRSVLVEALVSIALDNWRWCAGDYSPWDFDHSDGTRLEVKQTAFKQSWESSSLPKPSWDIAPRSGMWKGSTWIEGAGRNAEIYVLAVHRQTNGTADHRDATQWQFYVVPADRLPTTLRIGETRARVLAEAVSTYELKQAVETIRLGRVQ